MRKQHLPKKITSGFDNICITGLYNRIVLGAPATGIREISIEDAVHIVQLARHTFRDNLAKVCKELFYRGFLPAELEPILGVPNAIANGGRVLDVSFNRTLLDMYRDNHSFDELGLSVKEYGAFPQSFEYLRETSILSWAQMPGGFVDILCTLYIYCDYTN